MNPLQMPSGVEHISAATASKCVSDDESTSDAVRR